MVRGRFIWAEGWAVQGPNIAVNNAAASASERIGVMPLIVDQIRKLRGREPASDSGRKFMDAGRFAHMKLTESRNCLGLKLKLIERFRQTKLPLATF